MNQPLSTLIYVFPQIPKVSHFNLEGADIRRLLTCLCPLTYSLQLRGYNLIRLSFSVFLFYWKKFDVSVIVLLIYLHTLIFDVNLYSTKYPSSGGSFPFLPSLLFPLFNLLPSRQSSNDLYVQSVEELTLACIPLKPVSYSLPYSLRYLHNLQRDESADFMVDIGNWFHFHTYLILFITGLHSTDHLHSSVISFY